MNGRALPSSPGPTCAPHREAGASPRIFRTCRPGSSRRSAARPRTGPAPRCASTSTSSRIKSTYGNIPGANLLDWPITLAEMEPWYAKAEDKMGVTRTNGIPGLPGNNNFKVLEAGAKKLGYKEVHTGNMAINSEPRDGRGACQQIGFCFQGCKSGAKWSTLYTEIPKGEATGNLEVRPNSMVIKIEHDASGKVTGVVYADESGAMQRQKARVVAVAGNSIESPRLLLNSASNHVPGRPRQLVRAGRPQLHAAHDRQRVCGVREVGAHVSRHHHGRHHPRRGEERSRSAASSAATRWRRCRSACPSWRRSSIPAPGDVRSQRDGVLSAHGRHVAGRRGHAAGNQPHHARSEGQGQVRHAGGERAFRRSSQRHRDAQPRLQAGCRRLRGRRRHRDLPDAALSRARTTSAPTG